MEHRLLFLITKLPIYVLHQNYCNYHDGFECVLYFAGILVFLTSRQSANS